MILFLLRYCHMHLKTFLACSYYLKQFKFCLPFFIYFIKRKHFRNFMFFILPKKNFLFFRYSNFYTSFFHSLSSVNHCWIYRRSCININLKVWCHHVSKLELKNKLFNMFRIEEGMILISSPLIEHYIQSKFSWKRYVENVHQ